MAYATPGTSSASSTGTRRNTWLKNTNLYRSILWSSLCLLKLENSARQQSFLLQADKLSSVHHFFSKAREYILLQYGLVLSNSTWGRIALVSAEWSDPWNVKHNHNKNKKYSYGEKNVDMTFSSGSYLGVLKSRVYDIVCIWVLKQLLQVWHGEEFEYDLRLVSLLEDFEAFLNHIATELLHGKMDVLAFKLLCKTWIRIWDLQVHHVLDNIVPVTVADKGFALIKSTWKCT